MDKPKGYSSKSKYSVYIQYYLEAEEEENNILGKWEFIGDTYAVSEKQAINNVRHREFGDYGTSQYLPTTVSGHWENGFNWKAIKY